MSQIPLSRTSVQLQRMEQSPVYATLSHIIFTLQTIVFLQIMVTFFNYMYSQRMSIFFRGSIATLNEHLRPIHKNKVNAQASAEGYVHSASGPFVHSANCGSNTPTLQTMVVSRSFTKACHFCQHVTLRLARGSNIHVQLEIGSYCNRQPISLATHATSGVNY